MNDTKQTGRVIEVVGIDADCRPVHMILRLPTHVTPAIAQFVAMGALSQWPFALPRFDTYGVLLDGKLVYGEGFVGSARFTAALDSLTPAWVFDVIGEAVGVKKVRHEDPVAFVR